MAVVVVALPPDLSFLFLLLLLLIIIPRCRRRRRPRPSPGPLYPFSYPQAWLVLRTVFAVPLPERV